MLRHPIAPPSEVPAATTGGSWSIQSIFNRVKAVVIADYKTIAISLGSAAVVLILYKTFGEKESDLRRRLSRIGKDKKPVKIWVDGCFDLFHFGHANALRQARMLGDQLIVGVNSDEEIVRVKGPPIMNDEERITAVSACKWVDKVVTNVPYVLNEAYLQKIFDEFDVDFIVHGDDPCTLPDGTDVYALPKKLGKFKIIKRTEGVSTTDIVGRMLMNVKLHHQAEDQDDEHEQEHSSKRRLSLMSEAGTNHSTTNVSKFLPTSRRITQFSSGKSPKPTDKIVYIDGDWDLFHAGHVDLLQAARKYGDFLIVGVHRDTDVNRKMKENFPILNLHERVLSVLSCKFVDEVIIGAPWAPHVDMYKSLNISVVLDSDEYALMLRSSHYTASSPLLTPKSLATPPAAASAAITEVLPSGATSSVATAVVAAITLDSRHQVAKELGIYHEIKCPRTLTTIDIVQRVYSQMAEFTKKYEKKSKKEAEYVQQKEYVAEL